MTVARGSLEQDRFERLRKLKEGVECFQNLDLPQRQEVVKSLNIETGVKDPCATLLQDVLTEEKPEETSHPVPLKEDHSAKVVRLLFLLYIFAVNTQCLG